MHPRVIEVLESYASLYDLTSPVHQEVRASFLEAIKLIEESL
jgi:hypothetical protein